MWLFLINLYKNEITWDIDSTNSDFYTTKLHIYLFITNKQPLM